MPNKPSPARTTPDRPSDAGVAHPPHTGVGPGQAESDRPPAGTPLSLDPYSPLPAYR
jgi:hypothetical protein